MSRSLRVSVLVILSALMGACSSPSVEDPGPDSSRSAPPAPTTPTPSGASPGSTSPDGASPSATDPATEATPQVIAVASARAGWQEVGSGFEGPVQVLDGPVGQVLVVEQPGRIRTLAGEPWLDLTDRVTSGGERGLLGAAVHPDDDRLYVHYSGEGGRTVLSVLPVAGGAPDASDERVLFETAQPASNHNGGALLFTAEGHLVLALGDGGGAGDPFGNGQDPSTVLGTLLRFEVGEDGLSPAPGNPFLDGGGAPEVWAYGLRNPWRIAQDDERLYVADVGQGAIEEVSVVPLDELAGANFGWPVLEGSACYRSSSCDAGGLVQPAAELRHDEGACSIIGGVVVPDGHPTGLGGAFLFSDLCDTRLRALRVGDGVAAVKGGVLPASPLGFGTGADGAVWVGTTSGRVFELVAP